jgi:hypothetical protein
MRNKANFGVFGPKIGVGGENEADLWLGDCRVALLLAMTGSRD